MPIMVHACTRKVHQKCDHLGLVFPHYPTEWRAVKASCTDRGHGVIQQDDHTGHRVITLLYESRQVMQPK